MARYTPPMMCGYALAFDYHDTLIQATQRVPDEDWTVLSARQLEPLLRSWGARLDSHTFAQQLLQETRQQSVKASVSHVSPDIAAIIRLVAKRAGLVLDDREVDRLWRAWYVSTHTIGQPLYTDAITTLQWAKSRGYRLCLLTNRWFGLTVLEDELRLYGIDDMFDSILVSCDVGFEKPHREIFRLMLASVGLPPERVAMIGDSLQHDVQGAKRSGLVTVWKRNHRPMPRTSHSCQIRPDFIIDDLSELATLPLFVEPG